jgi:hypothetical protein
LGAVESFDINTSVNRASPYCREPFLQLKPLGFDPFQGFYCRATCHILLQRMSF